jgi:plastocyanin
MRSPTLFLAALLTALALAIAGCGDDDDSGDGGGGGGDSGGQAGGYGGGSGKEDGGSGGGGATTLKLTADPGGAIKFDKTSLSAKPGKVTVVMDNPSQVPHAVEIEGQGVEEVTETLTNGTAKVTVDLKAGEYEFYCPVGNHADQGMKGTLKVG